MDIDFRTNRLQKAYEESARAIRRWGPDVGRKFIQRIDDIYAMPDFDSVKAMRAWRAHELKGEYKGCWAIDIVGKWRLIVVPSDDGESLVVEEVTNHYGD